MTDAPEKPSDGDAADRVFEQFLQPERLERLERILDGRTASLTLVLDRVRNPHNISAVLRSADAFGLTEVHLVGGGFQYSPSISQGTERWMKVRQHETPEAAIAWLRERAFKLAILCPEDLAAGPSVRPIPATELPFDTPLALVFGNEHQGVSSVFSETADIRAFIPMYGFVESLNVSVACAICLFLSTVGRTKPERQAPGLSPDARKALRSEWLRAGVPRSDLILKEISEREKRRRGD